MLVVVRRHAARLREDCSLETLSLPEGRKPATHLAHQLKSSRFESTSPVVAHRSQTGLRTVIRKGHGEAHKQRIGVAARRPRGLRAATRPAPDMHLGDLGQNFLTCIWGSRANSPNMHLGGLGQNHL